MLTVEIQFLLSACEPYGLTREQVKADLSDATWCFPSQNRAKTKQLHRIFDPYRESSSDPEKLKCSASELLGLYQLLRWIVASRVHRTEELRGRLLSFDAACSVIEIISDIKRGARDPVVGAAELQVAVSRHLTLHLEAYGDVGIRPKHHWMFDVPGQIGRDRMILDLFIIERTHVMVKAVADTIVNTVRYERSVLAGVVNSLLHSQGSTCVHALLGKCSQVSHNVLVANKMRVYGLHIEESDIVLQSDVCGIVLKCLAIDGVLHVVVDVLQKEGDHTPNWGRWVKSGSRSVWIAAVLHHPVAWKLLGGNGFLVLR